MFLYHFEAKITYSFLDRMVLADMDKLIQILLLRFYDHVLGASCNDAFTRHPLKAFTRGRTAVSET
eukprot:6203860-Pleurochrysis_carterae.AAC.1